MVLPHPEELPLKSAVWKAVATLASIGAAVAARNAATAVWQNQVGTEPPNNPADPQTTWGEALGWTVATGVLVGTARLFARRGAAKVWEKVDGDLPPGLQEAV
jgi:uncharacterized membrane protein